MLWITHNIDAIRKASDCNAKEKLLTLVKAAVIE